MIVIENRVTSFDLLASLKSQRQQLGLGGLKLEGRQSTLLVSTSYVPSLADCSFISRCVFVCMENVYGSARRRGG